MTCVKEAIAAAGGSAKVAEDLGGLSRISVWEWGKKNRLPADRVIPLAKLTGWRFTPHMLDSQLYPNAADGLPVEEVV